MCYSEAKHQTPVLLSSGQETKCDCKSASRVDRLPEPCVIFLNSGPHPLQDLSEHGRVHPDKISERHHILSLQLPHQTIIVSIVQPPCRARASPNTSWALVNAFSVYQPVSVQSKSDSVHLNDEPHTVAAII